MMFPAIRSVVRVELVAVVVAPLLLDLFWAAAALSAADISEPSSLCSCPWAASRASLSEPLSALLVWVRK